MAGLNLFDKNGKEITLDAKLKDEKGTYVVRFGSLYESDSKEKDDLIAYSIDGDVEILLWPERTRQFEVVE